MTPGTYKNYLLAVLSAVFVFFPVDTALVGFFLQKIETDLSLSDAQMGLSSGIVFATFYSIGAIPFARWADRGSRVTIISVAMALWGAAVSLLAVAENFLQFMLFRIGAAVAASAIMPTSISLISDYFSRAERPKAISRLLIGTHCSLVITYFVGGWLSEWYGWRAVFTIIGAPGVALAVLIRVSLEEPHRRKSVQKVAATHSIDSFATPNAEAPSSDKPSLMGVCVRLITNVTLRQLLLSYAIIAATITGVLQWLPTFSIRRFGIETQVLGIWLVLFNVTSALGLYCSGEFVSRWAANNEALQLKAGAVINIFAGIAATFGLLTSNQYVACGLFGVYFFSVSLYQAPMYAMLQTLVPQRTRVQSTAVLGFVINLAGFGLGPWLVGVFSDVLRPWAGQEALRDALLALSPCYLWASWHLYFCSRTVTGDLQAVETDDTKSEDRDRSQGYIGT